MIYNVFPPGFELLVGIAVGFIFGSMVTDVICRTRYVHRRRK
jgi:hypothetical protein